MTSQPYVAVLVDCENAHPSVLDLAMQGRVTIRRGYGNQAALTSKCQDVLMRCGFAPALQVPVATGKNTADIALAWCTSWGKKSHRSHCGMPAMAFTSLFRMRHRRLQRSRDVRPWLRSRRQPSSGAPSSLWKRCAN